MMWVSKAEQNLNNFIRFLWMQNIYWLRMAVQSMIFDLPDAEVVNERLMQNPKDFEMAFQTFYGDENAAAFAELLTNHINLAIELVTAIMNADLTGASDAERRWYENAEEMATFLSSINPKWSEDDLQNMLQNHLEMITKAISDMMARNFSDSNMSFTNIERQTMDMADMMTYGIVNQFPEYFR